MHDNGSNSGTAQYAKFERARKQMVKGLHFRSCVSDKKVIEAMAEIPRHLFVPENVRDNAYDDTPLPIGWNQTISAPHMVGMMAELLELKPGLKVLEIGAGCGYHAAVVAYLVRPGGTVHTVERVPQLVEFARENLRKTGFKEVFVYEGDGTIGLEKEAPFDRIYVTAASPGVPQPLLDQLKDGGILVIPAGTRWHQDLLRIRRVGKEYRREDLGGCIFVPLIGKHGF